MPPKSGAQPAGEHAAEKLEHFDGWRAGIGGNDFESGRKNVSHE
jgi:hypothetical protein